MKQVRGALRLIARELHDLGRAYAIVGGFGVSARATPRTTRDVDVAVAVIDDADAEQLIFVLQSRGFRLVTAIEQSGTSRLATARTRAPGSDVLVDLLFASSGIEPEIAARAEHLELLRGVRVPVATIADLIAMKVLSRDDRHRPQDAMDLRALLEEADHEDREAARAALALVAERGFSRGKNLSLELDRALAELGPSS